MPNEGRAFGKEREASVALGARLGSQVGTTARGIAELPNIAALLGVDDVVLFNEADGAPADIDSLVGWGLKDYTAALENIARARSLPFFRLEDGFLRSVELSTPFDQPLSIVIDDCGIYYDARSPSRLENMLAHNGPADPLEDTELLARADALRGAICSARLSKYNNAPPGGVDLGERVRDRVLVVDQTAGDLSIACGLADANRFETMLDAAIAENPDAEIVVKTHPDVIAGKKKGHLRALASARPGVRVIDDFVAPLELLTQVDKVYVVTSQLGFEALVAGLPVVCFGVPFYAGWGLTDDRGSIPPRRNRERTLREVFAASYLLYPRYLNPYSNRPGAAEDVAGFLADQRGFIASNAGRLFCFGFARWKRNFIRAYLRCPGNEIHFAKSAEDAERLGFDSSCRLLTWGNRAEDAAIALMSRHGVPRWRVEDAFLRSVGLGTDITVPASLVIDREGIYFDPNSPSSFERICESRDFSAADVDRAAALRARIVATKISKYNVGRTKQLEVPSDKRIVLVPGQVQDDESIKRGCLDIRTNAALLAEARKARPDAYLIWKPHPDVVSGNRRGAVAREHALTLADQVEDDVSLADCLAVADEVHTMTSLVGFEALMRGLQVVVYGLPFYAGWGLTADRHEIARRSQKLTIDELCAAALIRYPRYLNPVTLRPSTPEVILDLLAAKRDAADEASLLKVSWARRAARRGVRWMQQTLRGLGGDNRAS